MSYIEFNNITKEYKTGEVSIKALDDASFVVEKGELAVILGSSGAGKTTALNILGGMDIPTSGEIIVDGNVITSYNKKKIVEYRREDIGFVFQFYNLVPNLTAEENVELAAQVWMQEKHWIKSGFLTERITSLHSCPAGNSRELRLPVRLQRTQNCFFVMNRQGRLIIILESRFCSYCRIPAERIISQFSSSHITQRLHRWQTV